MAWSAAWRLWKRFLSGAAAVFGSYGMCLGVLLRRGIFLKVALTLVVDIWYNNTI